jgi:hypothetical protein
MSVPASSFKLGSAGAYTVTVEVRWYVWGPLQWYRSYSLNAATDYSVFGDARVYNGYCYVY